MIRRTTLAADSDDVARSVELAETFASLDLGIVDASVIALAERLRVAQVLTLDRRDFSLVRPRHCASLTLTPAGKNGAPDL